MTEQYRVVADSDRGDDPDYAWVRPGDRITYAVVEHRRSIQQGRLVRIERPVPTTDEARRTLWDQIAVLIYEHDTTTRRGASSAADEVMRAVLAASTPAATREQIAEAIYAVRAGSSKNWHKSAFRDDYLAQADAVLALLENGADR